MIERLLTYYILRRMLVYGGLLATVETVVRIALFYNLPEPGWVIPNPPNYYQFNSPLTFGLAVLPFSIWMTYYAFRARVGPRLSLISLGVFGLALGLEMVMAYLLYVTSAEWTHMQYDVRATFIAKLHFYGGRGIVMTILYMLAIFMAEYDFRFGRKPFKEALRDAEEGRD